MAISQLPTEVWIQIASLIPAEDLDRLHTVNGAFLKQALDSRYHTVIFFGSGTSKMGIQRIRKNLTHLLQPYILPRILRFRIDGMGGSVLSLSPDVNEPGPTPTPTRFRAASKLLRPFGVNKPSRAEEPAQEPAQEPSIFDLVRKIILGSIQAKTIEIRSLSSFFRPPGSLFEIATYAMQECASRLESLDISGSVSLFHHLLRESACQKSFIHLRSLNMSITREPPYFETHPHLAPEPHAIESWCEFLKSVSPTLTRLVVQPERVYNFHDDRDLHFFRPFYSRAFQSLHTLPQLRFFEFRQSNELSVKIMPNILGLLERASSSLRHIDVPPCSASQLPPYTLSQLETLILREAPRSTRPILPTELEVAADSYINRCSRLRSLSLIRSLPFSHDVLACFFHRNCPQLQALEHLDIPIVAIHPQIFKVLAEDIPNLRSLVLRPTSGVVPDALHESDSATLDPTRSTAFSKDIWYPRFAEERPLTGWKLECLSIECTGGRYARFIDSDLAEELREGIMQLVPSLLGYSVGKAKL